MDLLTVPPSTAPTRYVFLDDVVDANTTTNSNVSTTYPPHNHQLQLQLPLRTPKHNLSRVSSQQQQPLQPLSPQTATWRNNNKNMTKKKKKKGSSTSDILSLMEALYNPIPIDIYTSLIKECTLSRDPQTAIDLHAHVTNNSGINNPPLPFINRILIMFASCGLLDTARQVFDTMAKRDFNSWATLFVAYHDNTDYDEAARVFVSMMENLDLGMMEFPSWIWVCLLKACACSANFHLGMQVHGWLLKLGNCDDDAILSSSLIRFYSRFNCLEDANVVFNRASRHNTMTWSAKILGGCREKQFSEVLNDFNEMGRQGIKKDSFTFSSVLKACGKMTLDHHERCGEQVHAGAIKLGLVSDNFVQCSLIAMYGRSGLLSEAELVFEMTRNNEGNVDCWNAMLMGYIHNGMYIEAVKFLYQMKGAGMQPQEYLLNEVRIACGSVNY